MVFHLSKHSSIIYNLPILVKARMFKIKEDIVGSNFVGDTQINQYADTISISTNIVIHR